MKKIVVKTRKPKSFSKKELVEAQHVLDRVVLAIYGSGADGSLLSQLVSRLCSGMDEGDRFYNASDDSWWEWRGRKLQGSGPPDGYAKTSSTCRLCRRGFPSANGVHYGTHALGMIPSSQCTDLAARTAAKKPTKKASR